MIYSDSLYFLKCPVGRVARQWTATPRTQVRILYRALDAEVAELVDAPDLKFGEPQGS